MDLTLIFSQLTLTFSQHSAWSSGIAEKGLRTPWKAFTWHKKVLEHSWGGLYVGNLWDSICPHSIWATTATYHIKKASPSKDQRHFCAKPFDPPVVIQPSFHDNGGNHVNKWIIFIGLFTRCWWKVVSKCLQEHLHWSGLLFVVWTADQLSIYEHWLITREYKQTICDFHHLAPGSWYSTALLRWEEMNTRYILHYQVICGEK